MIGKWQLRDHEAERRLFSHRLLVAGGLVLTLFTLLIFNLVNLQVHQYEYFSARADGNRLHSQYVSPSRGLIYDRNGLLLADNQPIHNLMVVREQVTDLQKSLQFLSGLVHLSDEEIAQFHKRSRRQRVPYSAVPLKLILSEEERSRIAVNSHRLPGFSIEAQFVRYYPRHGLMAHAVGYVSEINRQELERMDELQRENYGGSDHMGKTGAERSYETLLHGSVGYETVEKNNLGQIMRRLDRTDPVPGHDITLHLDSELQAVALEALGDYRGAVVAIDPVSGGILAMVSKPGFDPNLFVTGISNAEYSKLVNDHVNTPLFDRSTSPFPPGSTLKPFIGIAGLQLALIDYEYTIDDPGYFHLPGVSRRWHDWTFRSDLGGGHGVTDLRRAIYQSCDTFFYHLGHRMGIQGMHAFLSRFGFGRNFALDVGYARTGVLPSMEWKMAARGEPWYPGDTVNAAIGQGHTWMTPLQLATAVSIIANRGKVVRPRLLMAVDGVPHDMVDNEIARLLPSPPEEAVADIVLRDIDYWRYMEQAMVDVVHRGFTNKFRDYGGAYQYTAAQDQDMPYLMAGKTGTAQVVGISQHIQDSDAIEVSELHKDHALFVSYAPAQHPQHAPRIALAVLVENGEAGASVAAPMAKRITDAYLLDILDLDFHGSEVVEPEILESETTESPGSTVVAGSRWDE